MTLKNRAQRLFTQSWLYSHKQQKVRAQNSEGGSQKAPAACVIAFYLPRVQDIICLVHVTLFLH